jgi:hypothetical protein
VQAVHFELLKVMTFSRYGSIFSELKTKQNRATKGSFFRVMSKNIPMSFVPKIAIGKKSEMMKSISNIKRILMKN